MVQEKWVHYLDKITNTGYPVSIIEGDKGIRELFIGFLLFLMGKSPCISHSYLASNRRSFVFVSIQHGKGENT